LLDHGLHTSLIGAIRSILSSVEPARLRAIESALTRTLLRPLFSVSLRSRYSVGQTTQRAADLGHDALLCASEVEIPLRFLV
jgi:hypothetical protein